MAMILDILPYAKLTLGDTWSWSVTLQGFSASDGWAISYAMKKVGSSPILIPSHTNANGYTHDVLVAAGDNRDYNPGKYKVAIYMTKGADRQSLGTYEMELLPDLSQTSVDYDPRSFNEIALAALEDTLFNACGNEHLMVVFKDSQFKFKSDAELMKLRNDYKILVDLEKGISPGRILYLR